MTRNTKKIITLLSVSSIILAVVFFAYLSIHREYQKELDSQFLETSLYETEVIEFLMSLRATKPDNKDLIEDYIHNLLAIKIQKMGAFYRDNPENTISLHEKMKMQSYIASRTQSLDDNELVLKEPRVNKSIELCLDQIKNYKAARDNYNRLKERLEGDHRKYRLNSDQVNTDSYLELIKYSGVLINAVLVQKVGVDVLCTGYEEKVKEQLKKDE